MAIVRDKATDPLVILDRNYTTQSRQNAGTPNAVLTPAFAGELIFDTTNKVRWKSIGPTNAEWVPIDVEVV